MDQSDLYDYEVATIGRILKELTSRWSRTTNTKQNLQEFAKAANDMFLRAGFIVNVQWENTLIAVPDVTSRSGFKPLPITIEVLGRVQPLDEFDHERKRREVLTANDRGEKYLGQKDGKVIK